MSETQQRSKIGLRSSRGGVPSRGNRNEQECPHRESLEKVPDIVSNQDPRFAAGFWRELHQLPGVTLGMSTRDHPQTDDQTENANGVLEYT
jgi:hypothetical protein